MAAFKTLVFTVVVPGTVVGWLPRLILDRWPPAGQGGALRTSLAAAAFVAGVLLYLWCVTGFVRARGTPAPIDPPKELVVRGPYRFSRNPMYVAVLTVIVSEALFFGSIVLLGFAALIFSMFQSFIVFYEEPTLRRTFGPAFEEFCRRVPRWIGRAAPS